MGETICLTPPLASASNTTLLGGGGEGRGHSSGIWLEIELLAVCFLALHRRHCDLRTRSFVLRNLFDEAY